MLSTTEETILKAFTNACGQDGCIERVKKIKDYAFVHFKDRDLAIQAMNAMNGISVFFCSELGFLRIKKKKY